MAKGIVYLIPSLLDEEDIDSIPSCILAAINECEVFFAENERTARRYLKKLQRDIVIDQYEWHTLSDAPSIPVLFTQKIKEGKADYGFNARTEIYENLFKAGVIDPTKVSRVALENAASIAGMLLTTECVVADKPKEEAPHMHAGAPDMGGMGY